MENIPAKNVDDYLSALPVNVQVTLKKLRAIIKSLAPDAEEVISYQIPSYKYYGMLVGFAAFKNHCGFYIMDPPLAASMKDELKGYDFSGATIRFTPDKPLPAALVKKVVKARMKANEERAKSKQALKVLKKKM